MATETMTDTQKSTLPDVQNNVDQRGIALLKAGIKDVEMPITFSQPGTKEMTTPAVVAFTVGLEKEHKGVNMSRFMVQLTEWNKDNSITLDLKPLLTETQERLESDSAFVELAFKCFIDKPAPVSGITAPMAYDVTMNGSLIGKGKDAVSTLRLKLDMTIANCCPCSKAISEYGAHNQRALMKVVFDIDPTTDLEKISLNDMVSSLEEAASCPVFPILKRPDEKYVTERQYDNPKFVEDVARDAIIEIRKFGFVKGYSVQIEALESIHRHNAWAYHEEGLA